MLKLYLRQLTTVVAFFCVFKKNNPTFFLEYIMLSISEQITESLQLFKAHSKLYIIRTVELFSCCITLDKHLHWSMAPSNCDMLVFPIPFTHIHLLNTSEELLHRLNKFLQFLLQLGAIIYLKHKTCATSLTGNKPKSQQVRGRF